MAVYFLRHGESEANIKGLFAGQREAFRSIQTLMWLSWI